MHVLNCSARYFSKKRWCHWTLCHFIATTGGLWSSPLPNIRNEEEPWSKRLFLYFIHNIFNNINFPFVSSTSPNSWRSSSMVCSYFYTCIEKSRQHPHRVMRPDPLMGIWWDCSNDTRFTSLGKMRFTDLPLVALSISVL